MVGWLVIYEAKQKTGRKIENGNGKRKKVAQYVSKYQLYGRTRQTQTKKNNWPVRQPFHLHFQSKRIIFYNHLRVVTTHTHNVK